MKRKNELRDKIIRKTYKHGQGAVIGKWWHISRQRVWQIVHENGQTHHNQNLRVLVGWVKDYIKRLIVRDK